MSDRRRFTRKSGGLTSTPINDGWALDLDSRDPAIPNLPLETPAAAPESLLFLSFYKPRTWTKSNVWNDNWTRTTGYSFWIEQVAVGDIAGTAAITFTESGTLVGTGALAGSAALLFGAGSSTLVGSGALAGSSALTFAAGSSTLTASGTLAGSAALVFGAGSSTLTGSGALAGSSALAFDVTGSAVSGAIAGTLTLTFGGNGVLTGAGALAGTAGLTFDLSAALTGSGALAGASALAFDAAGDLTNDAAGAITGTAALAFDGSGTLVNIGVAPEPPSVSDALIGALEKRKRQRAQVGVLAGVARMRFEARATIRYQSQQVTDMFVAVAMAQHEPLASLDPARRKRNQKRAVMAALMFD